MQYATFLLNEYLFGIPIYLVQEFSPALEVFPIPGHDQRVAGLLNRRGRIAVVIDLKRCLGLPEAESHDSLFFLNRQKKMIVLETNDRLSEDAQQYGIQSYEEPLVLLVDKIHKIIDVDREDFYPPPAHVKETYVEGVVKVDDIVLTILSIAKLSADLSGVAGGMAAEA